SHGFLTTGVEADGNVVESLEGIGSGLERQLTLAVRVVVALDIEAIDIADHFEEGAGTDRIRGASQILAVEHDVSALEDLLQVETFLETVRIEVPEDLRADLFGRSPAVDADDRDSGIDGTVNRRPHRRLSRRPQDDAVV